MKGHAHIIGNRRTFHRHPNRCQASNCYSIFNPALDRWANNCFLSSGNRSLPVDVLHSCQTSTKAHKFCYIWRFTSIRFFKLVPHLRSSQWWHPFRLLNISQGNSRKWLQPSHQHCRTLGTLVRVVSISFHYFKGSISTSLTFVLYAPLFFFPIMGHFGNWCYFGTQLLE